MSDTAAIFWLKQWAKFNRGGYPGEIQAMDPSKSVSRGTLIEREPEWPDIVQQVDASLRRMLDSHEDWLSRQMHRVLRQEYISRFRNDVAKAKAARCGMGRSTYYLRVNQIHRWISNDVAFDDGRKVM